VLVRVRPGAPVQLCRFVAALSSIMRQLLAAEFVRYVGAPDKMSDAYRNLLYFS
jgi:hypothetical protein